MPYCPKCGRKLPEGAKFCSSCGEPVAPTELERVARPEVRRPSAAVRLAAGILLLVSGGTGFALIFPGLFFLPGDMVRLYSVFGVLCLVAGITGGVLTLKNLAFEVVLVCVLIILAIGIMATVPVGLPAMSPEQMEEVTHDVRCISLPILLSDIIGFCCLLYALSHRK